MSHYPKMHTIKLPNGKVVATVWPATHPLKGGQHVIFNNEDEEKEYDDSGIALTGPEQRPQEQPRYPTGNPWWKIT